MDSAFFRARQLTLLTTTVDPAESVTLNARPAPNFTTASPARPNFIFFLSIMKTRPNASPSVLLVFGLILQLVSDATKTAKAATDPQNINVFHAIPTST